MHLYTSDYKSSFKDNIRSTYLLSALGEAKQDVQVVGTCILFYCGAKKTLEKRPTFCKWRIKARGKLALPEFHQEIILDMTWLSSLGYNTPVYLYGSSTNAINYILLLLREEYYKHTKDAPLMRISFKTEWYFNVRQRSQRSPGN